MFLSLIHVNIGHDPDRPRPGRLWLRNLYRVHQRLCMAFPTQSRVSDDEDFLKPFKPEDFGPGQVHVARGQDAGFLFRIDQHPGAGRAMILVQSAMEPHWDYAFQNACYLLAAPPEARPYEPQFQSNQRLKFRLLANPVKKLREKSREQSGAPVKEAWVGKRIPVRTEHLVDWLYRRTDPGWSAFTTKGAKRDQPGFRTTGNIDVQPGYVHVNNSLDKRCGRQLRSARYEGILEVTNADAFRETLVCGIGPAKAFGFGLLSIAPVHSSFRGG